MPVQADCSVFEVHKGELGEAVTGQIAIESFALFMPLGSNTIRHNALRLLRGLVHCFACHDMLGFAGLTPTYSRYISASHR